MKPIIIALCVLIAGCGEPEVMPEGCVEFWSGSQRLRDCGESQYFRDLKINLDWTKVMDCKRIENGWKCNSELARRYGVGKSTIARTVLRQKWKHVP